MSGKERDRGSSGPSDQSYRTLLQRLEQQGELVRFRKTVDPLRNMAAVEWKTYNELGKSSLFTSIEGHPQWQACSQIVADRRKWAIGLGMNESTILEEIIERIRAPIKAVRGAPDEAPIKQVKLIGDAATLHDIPAMIVSGRDSGRFIPSGITIVKDPDTGIGNMSMHRQQINSRDSTGFVMLPRHARRIYDKYSSCGEPTPVAIVIGVHPAIWFAAGFTTSFGLDELDLAGGLLREPVRTVRCESIDIDVPADAEVVLEGELLPGDHLEPEGPFGEVTGTYPDPGMAHVFRLKAITRRRDPIYYALHCGFPATDTQSTTSLGIEIATMEHLRKVDGGLDLLDVRCLPVSGLMMLVIKICPRVEGQAKVALMAALSGPYQQPKMALAVDEDIDAGDLRQLMWSIATRVEASRDIVTIPNVKVWGLDNSSPVIPGVEAFQRLGTKWMIDATKPALTMGVQRARFDKAMPFNYDTVDLADFLP
jgi:2,5-furandicarboxylate decarboxylase 1